MEGGPINPETMKFLENILKYEKEIGLSPKAASMIGHLIDVLDQCDIGIEEIEEKGLGDVLMDLHSYGPIHPCPGNNARDFANFIDEKHLEARKAGSAARERQQEAPSESIAITPTRKMNAEPGYGELGGPGGIAKWEGEGTIVVPEIDSEATGRELARQKTAHLIAVMAIHKKKALDQVKAQADRPDTDMAIALAEDWVIFGYGEKPAPGVWALRQTDKVTARGNGGRATTLQAWDAYDRFKEIAAERGISRRSQWADIATEYGWGRETIDLQALFGPAIDATNPHDPHLVWRGWDEFLAPPPLSDAESDRRYQEAEKARLDGIRQSERQPTESRRAPVDIDWGEEDNPPSRTIEEMRAIVAAADAAERVATPKPMTVSKAPKAQAAEDDEARIRALVSAANEAMDGELPPATFDQFKALVCRYGIKSAKTWGGVLDGIMESSAVAYPKRPDTHYSQRGAHFKWSDTADW